MSGYLTSLELSQKPVKAAEPAARVVKGHRVYDGPFVVFEHVCLGTGCAIAAWINRPTKEAVAPSEPLSAP